MYNALVQTTTSQSYVSHCSWRLSEYFAPLEHHLEYTISHVKSLNVWHKAHAALRTFHSTSLQSFSNLIQPLHATSGPYFLRSPWTHQPASRPSLLALRDARFSARVKIGDESGNGLLGVWIAVLRSSKSHNFPQARAEELIIRAFSTTMHLPLYNTTLHLTAPFCAYFILWLYLFLLLLPIDSFSRLFYW